MIPRRKLLEKIFSVKTIRAFGGNIIASNNILPKQTNGHLVNLYRSINGSSPENLIKVIEMMGGIETIIGFNDVVVVKPNVQWWNQGAPNLSAINAFVGIVMNRNGGFSGEVIMAENCHRGKAPWKHGGWAYEFLRNSDLKDVKNFNDLSETLKKKYDDKFSTCHWVDVDSGGARIYNNSEGTGYIYCDGTGGAGLISLRNGAQGNDYREVIMTYPVFKTDNGTIVDFKNGVWENGSYNGRSLKLINFAALNYHSIFCGATGAIKNYMGISDLSGGVDPNNGGKLMNNYYNFHSFPFNGGEPGPVSGMVGAEIAVFINTIRKADLNITTAEWVGLSSRTEPPVARTRAVLAGKDPVALDYHATKYVLYPNSEMWIHNPDNPESPLHQYLMKCSAHGGGEIDESKVDVKSWDFSTGRFQGDDEMVVMGEREWGWDVKTLMKYFYLRYFWYG